MYWQQWSDRLKRETSLGTEPLAVSYAGAPAPGTNPAQGKVSVCQAIKRACEGEVITITAQTCGCPGGLASLGLGELSPQGRERIVDFLVNHEKVYCSRIAIHRGQQSVPRPMGVASHVHFTPLSKAEILPDLIVFIGKPGALHPLVSFAGYWEGGPIKAELSGPACRTGIAYPIVTGEIGLSILDSGARKLARFPDDHLLLAIPFHRMIGIMHALDQGIGAARDEDTESMERRIDQFGKVEPV